MIPENSISGMAPNIHGKTRLVHLSPYKLILTQQKLINN